jgi:peroxiredoxin
MKTTLIIISLLIAITALNANPSDSTATLHVGDTIPTVEFVNADGSVFELNKDLQGKPLVIMFYRANWCPYCNLQLSEMQDIERQLIKLGFKLVAIAPETNIQQLTTKEKNFLKMLLLSDASRAGMNAYGIANGGVPHPTVIITDSHHVIRYLYTDKDYTKRVSADVVLEEAKKVK